MNEQCFCCGGPFPKWHSHNDFCYLCALEHLHGARYYAIQSISSLIKLHRRGYSENTAREAADSLFELGLYVAYAGVACDGRIDVSLADLRESALDAYRNGEYRVAVAFLLVLFEAIEGLSSSPSVRNPFPVDIDEIWSVVRTRSATE